MYDHRFNDYMAQCFQDLKAGRFKVDDLKALSGKMRDFSIVDHHADVRVRDLVFSCKRAITHHVPNVHSEDLKGYKTLLSFLHDHNDVVEILSQEAQAFLKDMLSRIHRHLFY